MASFIPTVGGCRVELLQLLSGQQIENTWNVQYPTEVGTGTMGTLANAFLSWWGTHMSSLISQDLQVTGCRVTDLTTASSPVVLITPGSTLAGTVNSPALPNNVASVVTARTANRGRAYRGRTYVPGIPRSDEQTPTAITLTEITALITALTALIGVVAPLGGFLGVRSTHLNNVARVAGVITQITGYDANADFDSQRRRLAGRGQ